MAQQTHDAIIVGGGLAGGLAALALDRAGLDVAVIDAVDPETLRSERYDGRTTALAYASARVFRRLGLWDDVSAEAEPILDILVTDGRRPEAARHQTSAAHLHFDSRRLETGEPLGYIVENRALRASIFAGLARARGAVVFAPASVVHASFGPAAAEVTLADGRALSAPLIIAADGRRSALRTAAGIATSEWSYAQTGIVATIGHERPHRGVAYEHFLPSGPFAILPMTANRSSIVWTEASAAAKAFLGLGDAAFLEALRQRVGDFLGRLSLAGPRWSYPLAFHLSRRFFAPRLVLIGDAARAIHPIAGQGFNLGVKDAAALAAALGEARGLGLDIGSPGALAAYQRWRGFDSAALALGTDALNRLFSNDFAPLRLARGVGLRAVNSIAPLTRMFMRQAGGDLGALPPLMQAER